MFDPLRAKARVIVIVAVGFLGGLGVASTLGWTGTSYAMPTITQVPQVDQEAVRPALDLSEAFANAAEAVTPAVVRIEVSATVRRGQRGGGIWPFSDPNEGRPTLGGGSGFLISDDGYILTNNHVVQGADEIRVHLTDGRYFIASLVGTDVTTDVAVIKIDEGDLPFLSLGNSSDLRVGEWILAIGNPGFGAGPASADDLDYTVTAGIVSAKGRPLALIQNELANDPEFRADEGFAIEDYIQTDAVINRGNSGGPMVNILGQVVGINSAIFSPSGTYVGYGFAIPIDLAGRVMEDLIEYGRVRRAWIGVSMREITQEDAEYYDLPEVSGVFVNEATEGGPADGVGIRQGDVIYSVNGTIIRSPNRLQNLIAQMRPGEEVRLVVYRDGSPRDHRITLGEADFNAEPPSQPEPEPATAEEKLGIGVQELTPDLAQYLQYPEPGGVVITELSPLGPALRRGVGRFEKLLQINDQAISESEDVQRILRGIEPGEVVSLRLGQPDGSTRIVNVRAGG